MAYALVVETNASPAGASSFTISKTPTAGNLLILAVHYHSTSITLQSVSDTQGNTWTIIGNSPSVSPGERVGLAYAYGVSGSAATITVTASSGTPTCSYSLSEWSGFTGANPLDKNVTGSGASGNTSVTLTGVVANALIFMASTRNGGNSTPTANYTGLYQRGDFYYEHGEYDLDSGASGNIVVNATGTSSNWTAIAASFAVPAGGGSNIGLTRRTGRYPLGGFLNNGFIR